MKVKTASDLKYMHELNHPKSYFFDRKSMRFFGDTMNNYGIKRTTAKTRDGETVAVIELRRKRPVKHGLQSSAFFDVETFQRLHDIDD